MPNRSSIRPLTERSSISRSLAWPGEPAGSAKPASAVAGAAASRGAALATIAGAWIGKRLSSSRRIRVRPVCGAAGATAGAAMTGAATSGVAITAAAEAGAEGPSIASARRFSMRLRT